MAKSTASHSQPWQLFRLKFAKKVCPYCGKVYCLSFPALAIVQIKVCSKCLPMCPYCGKVYNTPSTLPQRWQWSRLIFCGFISCLFQTLNTSTLPLAQSQYCVYILYTIDVFYRNNHIGFSTTYLYNLCSKLQKKNAKHGSALS